MKYFTLIIFILFSSLSFSQLPDFEWASPCGNPPNTTDTKTTIASCTDGTFFLAGEFLDTVQFGDHSIVSNGGTDVFIARMADGETPEWSVSIGAADYDFVQKAVADEDGNVIVTGYFYGTTQIGQDSYTSLGSQDVFLAKFSPDGAFLWSYHAGGGMADYITGLAVDADRNIVVSGYFYNTMTFGDTTLSATGSSDIYLAKFSPGGDLLWVTAAGGTSSDQVQSASCDPQGNILITGAFYYNFTISDTTITTDNPVGVFVARFAPDGLFEQADQLNGTYLTTEVYLKTSSDGGFYLSGNFSEDLTFGDQTFTAGEFNQDIFLAAYDASFGLRWARHAHSKASDQVVSIDTDPYDNIILTGHYMDTIHFEQVSLPYTLCCGSREIFITGYGVNGEALWGEQVSGAYAGVHSLSVCEAGELLISGLFTGEVVFGDIFLRHDGTFLNYTASLQTEIFTGVSQTLSTKDLKIFPNPVQEMFRLDNQSNDSRYEFSVYSVTGALVFSGSASGNEFIDVSALKSGTYIIRINSSGSIFSGRFIKN